eukprot:scpid94444/ scgid5789/ 
MDCVFMCGFACVRVCVFVRMYVCSCVLAGGPLVVGDIEDLAVGDPCIVCPFHKYRFRIRTGKNSFPGQPEFDMETYPVRVKGGGRLFIGFAQLSQKCFEEQDF